MPGNSREMRPFDTESDALHEFDELFGLPEQVDVVDHGAVHGRTHKDPAAHIEVLEQRVERRARVLQMLEDLADHDALVGAFDWRLLEDALRLQIDRLINTEPSKCLACLVEARFTHVPAIETRGPRAGSEAEQQAVAGPDLEVRGTARCL